MATLARGAQGKAVKEMQEALLRWHGAPFPASFKINSVFDAATEASLKDYQEYMNLSITGKATNTCQLLLKGNTVHARASGKPLPSKQTRGQFTCWAHATSSYFWTTNNTLKDHPPEFWIDHMGSKKLTSTLDGLSAVGWEALANYAALTGKIYTDSAKSELKTRAPRALFGGDLLYDLVMQHAFIILVYNVTTSITSPIAHAVVLYGVKLDPGSAPHTLLIMDPMTGFRTEINYDNVNVPVAAVLWNKYYKPKSIVQAMNVPFGADLDEKLQ